MSVFQKLTEKSWLEGGDPDSLKPAPDFNSQLMAERIALGFFLAIVTVLFTLFFVTFITHSQYPDFEPLAGETWRPLSDRSLLWINTALLAVSGVAMHTAWHQGKRDRTNASLLAMMLAAFFGLLFVVGQLWLWRQMASMGHHLTANPASSYFYLLTAVHGMHLLGGVVVLTRCIVHFWRGASERRRRASLALCTVYWHYLFGLWALVFALLVASPDTYAAIAAACGLD